MAAPAPDPPVESARSGPEPAAGAPPVAPWPPRPAELATWPIAWRQRWGELANQNQDRGVPWPDHERQAFEQVEGEMTEATT
jgi:hypothetical protein